MPLPSPNLDDRTFEQLVAEARQRILASAPGWTDLSVGDPGMALVDVFAYLADTTIFRLNQVPAKLYVEFLRLIGVQIQPPSAATTTLVFSRSAEDAGTELELPRGTPGHGRRRRRHRGARCSRPWTSRRSQRAPRRSAFGRFTRC